MPTKKSQKRVTTLQIVKPKKSRKFGTPVTSSARALFLHTFELSFGNISNACRAADISRQTYYRWINSPTRVNQRFRERLARLKPEEARLDFLEAAHTELVNRGDVAAVIFGLKTKASARGWVEPSRNAPATTTADVIDVLSRVALAFTYWATDHPEISSSEKSEWVKKFADRSGVPYAELTTKLESMED